MKDKVQELQELILKGSRKGKEPDKEVMPEAKVSGTPVEQGKDTGPALTVVHESKLLFKGSILSYYVLGELSQDLSALKVTLLITDGTDKRHRFKIDLYEKQQCRDFCFEAANLFYMGEGVVMTELLQLINLLEQYRESQVISQQVYYKKQDAKQTMAAAKEKEAIEFLSQDNLMSRLDGLLEQAGIIGNETIRTLLYLAGASYKSSVPLHIGIEGSVGIVRNLITDMAQCLPSEDSLYLTHISSRALYHCNQNELMNKTMLLPNGIDKKSDEALSQLQQGHILSTATTVKDKKLGGMVSELKQVYSHFSSLMYLQADQEKEAHILNISAESDTGRIIEYENKKRSGQVDVKQENKARELLQNIVRCLKPIEVINPHAHKVLLPLQGDAMIEGNRIYQGLVNMLCLLHQYQRKSDKDTVIADAEDMRIAFNMLFQVMAPDGDELEISLRRFFERVKSYVKKTAGEKAQDYRFSMLELRQALKLSKNFCFRYMEELRELEYVERTGYANKGFKYKVNYWDDVQKEKAQVEETVNRQLSEIEQAEKQEQDRTPEGAFRTQDNPESYRGKGVQRIYARGLRNSDSRAHLLNDTQLTYKKPTTKKNTK